MLSNSSFLFFFFFNDTATTEIYTLSLHDALPIWLPKSPGATPLEFARQVAREWRDAAPFVRPLTDLYCQVRFGQTDRKSTRLNSSHLVISYAVFCLKKKKKNNNNHDTDQHVYR